MDEKRCTVFRLTVLPKNPTPVYSHDDRHSNDFEWKISCLIFSWHYSCSGTNEQGKAGPQNKSGVPARFGIEMNIKRSRTQTQSVHACATNGLYLFLQAQHPTLTSFPISLLISPLQSTFQKRGCCQPRSKSAVFPLSPAALPQGSGVCLRRLNAAPHTVKGYAALDLKMTVPFLFRAVLRAPETLNSRRCCAFKGGNKSTAQTDTQAFHFHVIPPLQKTRRLRWHSDEWWATGALGDEVMCVFEKS